MKLAVNVPNFGPGTTPATILAWVRFAEDAGFDLAMMSDHVAVTAEVAALYPPPFYDPFTTLAWLAGVTDRIGLGTTVAIVPYRDPLLVARMAAGIDRISGGRFVLGVGVGWARTEYEALRVPFEQRGAITDDHLAAIRALWADEVASHDGPYGGFTGVRSAPLPVRPPGPPVWVGGTSNAAISRAVRFGDAWHPNNAEVPWLRDVGLPRLAELAERAGRARPGFAPRMRVHRSALALEDDTRRHGEGSAEQIAGDVLALAELGADHVVLDTNPDRPADRAPMAADHDDLHTVLDLLAGA